MREDIAARYRDMTSNPQQIIYSTIPREQRRDYLPARGDKSQNTIPQVYDAEDFVLSDDAAQASLAASANPAPTAVDGSDKPAAKKPDGKPGEPQNVDAAAPVGSGGKDDDTPAQSQSTTPK